MSTGTRATGGDRSDRRTLRQEEYDLLLCEQPVAGVRGLAKVAERIACPVMADESAWTVQDVLELDRASSRPAASPAT